ncbi:Hypp6904 [Branchiostoma lanceolatum]|uniref:Hypp6904 protein n=1 Tax=Branchiostoma lanceolatum TaxID=7740 RepID=A0A8J9YVR3_BRALA|nr:Hypp6904 [Branchiostoma lanceolatum]
MVQHKGKACHPLGEHGDDIVYMDATGNVIGRKVGGKTYCAYELIVRHPKKGHMPILVAHKCPTNIQEKAAIGDDRQAAKDFAKVLLSGLRITHVSECMRDENSSFSSGMMEEAGQDEGQLVTWLKGKVKRKHLISKEPTSERKNKKDKVETAKKTRPAEAVQHAPEILPTQAA